MTAEPVIIYIKELLESWQKTNTRGEITVIRLESGDIDVISSPRKRFRKEEIKARLNN
jgi:hypothetical protein